MGIFAINIKNLQSNLIIFLNACRIRQWIKNLIVFLPLIFALENQWNTHDKSSIINTTIQALVAFTIFCFLASGTYLINDLLDLKNDQLHPKKRFRPLAMGSLSTSFAKTTATILILSGLGASLVLNTNFMIIALSYSVITIAYSKLLKHIVWIEILILICGYVLRAIAGAFAIEAPISIWLYVIVGLSATLIGLIKRKSEIENTLTTSSRNVLNKYDPIILKRLIYFVSILTIFSYSFYTLLAKSLPDNNSMAFTIPIATYCLYRYLKIANGNNLGESPEEILWKDRPIKFGIVIWLFLTIFILFSQ